MSRSAALALRHELRGRGCIWCRRDCDSRGCGRGADAAAGGERAPAEDAGAQPRQAAPPGPAQAGSSMRRRDRSIKTRPMNLNWRSSGRCSRRAPTSTPPGSRTPVLAGRAGSRRCAADGSAGSRMSGGLPAADHGCADCSSEGRCACRRLSAAGRRQVPVAGRRLRRAGRADRGADVRQSGAGVRGAGGAGGVTFRGGDACMGLLHRASAGGDCAAAGHRPAARGDGDSRESEPGQS